MGMALKVDQVQIDRGLTVLQRQGRCCPVKEVPVRCPDLTDDQIFLAIDYLARTRQFFLGLQANGMYWKKS